MSLQVENLEHNMVKLTIEVPAEELEGALQKSYMKQKKNLNIPGFRKGKVPRNVVEKMFGVEVLYEDAANYLIQDAYGKAYDESELEIVSQPTIEVTQIEKGKPFIFTAEVAVKPEVTLGQYKDLEVDAVNDEVTEEEIVAKLAEEQEKSARIITVTDRPVQKKDDILLDFEGFIDGEAFAGGKGENYQLTIGSGSFIPGFEDQLIGAEIGKEVEVNVDFPEDYHAEELKGKPAVFKCTVNEIKGRELPELNDEFASDASEFATLDEWKADIEAKIKEQKAAEGKKAQEDQAIDAAVANASMDIPEAMIETEARQMFENFKQRLAAQGLNMDQYAQFTGLTQEKMLEEMRPQAEQRIRTRLVLEAVALAENIEIEDAKLEEEVASMAEACQVEPDKLKEYMGEKELEQMRKDLAVQEAVKFVADHAVVK